MRNDQSLTLMDLWDMWSYNKSLSDNPEVRGGLYLHTPSNDGLSANILLS